MKDKKGHNGSVTNKRYNSEEKGRKSRSPDIDDLDNQSRRAK